MSSESYEICNNYQIYSPGEIWTIYFSNVKAGDTITIENYYTIEEINGENSIDYGKSVTNTFGQEITFPNTDPPPGDSPCGTNTSTGRCYTIQNLIPQEAGKTIHTSPDTKISMNNNIDDGTGQDCVTNNFTINYAPSGIPIPTTGLSKLSLAVQRESQYTGNLGAITVYQRPLAQTGVNWNQSSDRRLPHGGGVDIKHNSYERYIRRLKGHLFRCKVCGT